MLVHLCIFTLYQDEVFFITKGNYVVKIGDEVFNLKPDDTATLVKRYKTIFNSADQIAQ
jgi:hypothetical protein